MTKPPYGYCLLSLLLLCLVAPLIAQETSLAYISPNFDGHQDSLILPLKIRDERYIVSYNLIIKNAEGKIVRAIRNKETRPETADFGNIVDRFFRLKEGLKLPKFLVWDGKSDEGTVVPDGIYSYQLDVSDDNNNLSKTDPRRVMVATKMPSLKISALQTVFSPTGDRPQLIINQSCDPGFAPIDTWDVALVDASGKTVRHWVYADALPPQTIWDGKDNNGLLAADGIYTFRIFTSDRAGNQARAEIGNLQLLNQATPINISIDNAWFSPNGDGIKDTVLATITGNDQVRVVNWVANLIDSAGQTWKSYRGSETLPRTIELTGLDDKGKAFPEGHYRLVVSALYVNGNKPANQSSDIVLGLTKPSARAVADLKIFSPNGDSSKDKLTIQQSGSQVPVWEGQMVRGDGKDGQIMRSWTWRNLPDATLQWDGRDQSGFMVPDGYYTYQLRAIDQAGNSGWSTPLVVKVDNRPTVAIMKTSCSAFSPFTESPIKSIDFSLGASITEGLETWRLRVFASPVSTAKAILEWSGSGPPPSQITWDGRGSDGGTVPDGKYIAQLSLAYEKGDKPTAWSTIFIVDTSSPSATISAENSQFSPDGDGVQDNLVINQETSQEDSWKGIFYNEKNQIVKSFAWAGKAPATLSWNGTDNAGNKLPDGFYRYELSSRDPAGNTASERLVDIKIQTEKPELALTIGNAAFSPNGDEVQDEMVIIPQLKNNADVKAWKLQIKPFKGGSARLVTGTESVPGKLFWDGKTDGGRLAPEGDYMAILSVEYRSGQSISAISPKFSLDTTPPTGSNFAEPSLFSPNADGFKDTIIITQDASNEDLWTGTIKSTNPGLSEAESAVRTFSWVGKPPKTIMWDGSDNQGGVVPDGTYTYQLTAKDQAGNLGASTPIEIRVDNRLSLVSLKADQRWFSPGVATRSSKMGFSIGLDLAEGIDSWQFEVRDAGGNLVRSYRGSSNPPEKFEWDGRGDSGNLVADGEYFAQVKVNYLKGDRSTAKSEPFVIDTNAPKVMISSDDLLFSPDGDGYKDLLRIKQSSSAEELWRGEILNAVGQRVREFSWKGIAQDFNWDGRDDNGNRLPDGTYRYLISSTDQAGNTGRSELKGIIIDNRPTSLLVSVDRKGFAPGSGRPGLSSIVFRPVVTLGDGILGWNLKLINVSQNSTIVRTISGTGMPPLSIFWDGLLENSTLAPRGNYEALMTVEYRKGNRPQFTSPGFVVDSEGPKVKMILTPSNFSPDDDGENDELNIGLTIETLSPIKSWKLDILDPRGQQFASFWGQGAPGNRLVWNGRSDSGELVQSAMDYSLVLTIVDSLDNRSLNRTTVSVDLLVLRDGDQLRIRVPGFSFPQTGFDPTSPAIDKDKLTINNRLLEKVAELLRKFGSYQVMVEDHANYSPTGDPRFTDQPSQADLLSQSEKRAAAVREAISKRGIPPGRLSSQGMGGNQPLVPSDDSVNAWKNNRIELILKKPLAGSSQH